MGDVAQWKVVLTVVVIALGVGIGLWMSSRMRKGALAPGDEALEKHMPLINSYAEPAIGFTRSTAKMFSKLGGLPSLPAGEKWPQWKGKPLAFLCQIDLAALPKGTTTYALPSTGVLSIFYDQEQNTWGFDPKDAGSWAVMYSASFEACVEQKAPSDLQPEYIYPEKYLTFTTLSSYPDLYDSRIKALKLSDPQFDAYCELRDGIFSGQPAHHLFGYPSPVQGNDMDLECQLASNGLYLGDATGYNDPRAKTLEAGRKDWVLLLQLDTDDDANMMWGDMGMLYFYIKQDDLAAKRFDRCWMILQCG
jgi:uncharacterized protein YwqG